MDEDTLSGVCTVCQAKTATGLHFGAVTCYPCRAFFRRIPQRKRPPRCKQGGNCEIVTSKHCPGCRFQSCLRAGMELGQVLSEEQRKERFSSCLRRKRAAQEETSAAAAVESDSSPAEENFVSNNFSSSPTNDSAVTTFLESTPRRGSFSSSSREGWFKGSTRENFSQSPPAAASLLAAFSRHTWTQQEQPWRVSNDSATDQILKAGPSQVGQPRVGGAGLPSWSVQPSYPPPSSTFTPTATNHPIYPDFGSKSQQIHDDYQRPAMKVLDVSRALQLPYLPTEPASEEEEGFPKMEISLRRPSVIQAMRGQQPPCKLQRMSVVYPETFVGDGACSQPEEMEENPRKVEPNLCDDQETQIILKYIHKKFNRSSLTGSGSGLKQEQQRSTVIVNPSTSSSYDLVKVNTDKSENEEKEKEEEDEGLLLPEMENIDMKDLKDIQTICMSFLAEEPPFMQEKQQLFYNAWYEVNMGEVCMSHFINFVKHRASLPLSFFVMAGKQYRERYVSGTCALDLVHEVPQETFVRVLRERLHFVYILTLIMLANLSGTNNLTSFLLSTEDMKQWQEEASGTEWPCYKTVLRDAPASQETRLELINKMSTHVNPVFTDRSVHMMMVVLALFHSEDQDESVRRIHEVALAMLRSYLRANHGEADYSTARILRCVSDLPAIMRLRNKMIEEGEQINQSEQKNQGEQINLVEPQPKRQRLDF